MTADELGDVIRVEVAKSVITPTYAMEAAAVIAAAAERYAGEMVRDTMAAYQRIMR